MKLASSLVESMEGGVCLWVVACLGEDPTGSVEGASSLRVVLAEDVCVEREASLVGGDMEGGI